MSIQEVITLQKYSPITAYNFPYKHFTSKVHELNNIPENHSLLPETQAETKLKDEIFFRKVFSKITVKVTSHPDHGDMNQINTWVQKVMDCNVPNGKGLR